MLLCGVQLSAASAADGDPVVRPLHQALLVSLLARPTATDNNSGNVDSASPQQQKLNALCRSFVREGGFLQPEAKRNLGLTGSGAERAARLFHALDGDRSRVQAPELPDPVLSAATMALCYARPSADGEAAARQCAALIDNDLRTQDTGAVAYRLLSSCLTGEKDKQFLLKDAASVAQDDYVGRMIRSVRLQEWRKLNDESAPLGKFQRALAIWFHTNSSGEARQKGDELLETPESRAMLQAMNAAYYGADALPDDVSQDAGQLASLSSDLYDMASEGFVLPVPDVPDEQPATSRTGGTPSVATPVPPAIPTPAAPDIPAPTPAIPERPYAGAASRNMPHTPLSVPTIPTTPATARTPLAPRASATPAPTSGGTSTPELTLPTSLQGL